MHAGAHRAVARSPVTTCGRVFSRGFAPRLARGDRLFALFCGVSWVWVYFRMPETKGQSLEQIQTRPTEAKT